MGTASSEVEFEVHEDDVRLTDTGTALVTIDAARFRLEGWKPDDENDPCEADHCGTDDCSCDLAEPFLEAVAKWHNETHPGAFSWCDDSPCRELREVGRSV